MRRVYDPHGGHDEKEAAPKEGFTTPVAAATRRGRRYKRGSRPR